MKPTAWVICCGYECYSFMAKCLSTVHAQDYEPLRVIVVDDDSPDQRQRDLVDSVNKFEDWTGVVNTERVGATANIWRAITEIATPDPQDVCVLVDADDWFTSSRSVSTIMAAYETDPNAWVVYGSYESVPPNEMCPPAEPYPIEVVRDRSFRQWSQSFNHPLSFKSFLFDQVDVNDLKDDDGGWVMYQYDDAIMLNLLELAGPNHRCLNEVTYAYRSDNPDSCNVRHKEEMQQVGAQLRARPKKPRMYLHDNGLTLAPEDRAALIAQTMLDNSLSWCVETGTGYGDMACRVAQFDWVERVVTIEADEGRYRAAVTKLVRFPNVLPVLGESTAVLRNMALSEMPAAVWWLDAHEDDWAHANPAEVCPVLDELYLILNRGNPRDTILVDDARLFGYAAGYPTVGDVRSQVSNMCAATGARYSVSVSYDVIRIEPIEV